jgi:hypothetical protein
MANSLLEFINFLVEDEISKLGSKNKTVTIGPDSKIGQDVAGDVFDMIQKSYAKIGGHAKIRSPGDVGAEYPVWDLADVDDDPEPDVARLSSQSSTTGGLKAGVIATDGSGEAKAYHEKRVRELLGGKEITWHGAENPEGDNMGASGWYTRKIGGVPHAKIIVGNV